MSAVYGLIKGGRLIKQGDESSLGLGFNGRTKRVGKEDKNGKRRKTF